MRDTFLESLVQFAEKDPDIMLLTGDLGFKVLDEFRERLPRQFLNMGIAEQNMAGVATGLAQEGKKVFTYSIANFVSLRCLEQIRNDCAYHDLNINVVCIGGGFSYGPLGMSHHATEDIAIMRALPGVSVYVPGDMDEVRGVTEVALNESGVSYLRLDKSFADATTAVPFQRGRARELRSGDDLTIVVAGGVLGEALKAEASLRKNGTECRVLSFHSLTDIDYEALTRAATETGGILTVEEHVVRGGLGGLVAEELLEKGIVPRQFARLGVRGGYCSIVGSQQYLRGKYSLDAEGIEAIARSMIEGDVPELVTEDEQGELWEIR